MRASLVAEDNPVNQDVATGVLENMGCKVVTAPNGAVAARLLAQEKFDLVLMDCEMPEMDGFEATRRIRQLEKLTGNLETEGKPARTPIVALTAHALADIRDRCIAAGMDDFLVKPFDEVQMGQALRRWIGEHPGTRAHGYRAQKGRAALCARTGAEARSGRSRHRQERARQCRRLQRCGGAGASESAW